MRELEEVLGDSLNFQSPKPPLEQHFKSKRRMQPSKKRREKPINDEQIAKPSIFKVKPIKSIEVMQKTTYDEIDLYRPNVNLIYGTNFLSIYRYTFGDKVYALSSYNAGAGYTSIWYSLDSGDIDLFVEIVRIEETRNYIRWIYEQFSIYRDLYTDFSR